MKKDDFAFEAFIEAAVRGDIAAVRAQVTGGFDLHATDPYGESVLAVVISGLEVVVGTPAPHRYEVVSALLALGFDPNQLDSDFMGPLTEAVLAMDTEMLRLLLDAGARPNATAGFFRDNTLYDWAAINYVGNICARQPILESATSDDYATEDAQLAWLDRMAIKHQRRRPDHLLLLRERGAKTEQELIAERDQKRATIEPLRTTK